MHRVILIFSLVFVGAAAPLTSARARQAGGEPSIILTTDGPAGTPVTVDGIVCDNLRDTPTGQKNHLDLRLPDSFRASDIEISLANPDGTTADAKGRTNVGSVVFHDGRITYYPPDEFNTLQQPENANEVDGPATRVVLLTIRRPNAGGGWQMLPSKPIVVARPPAILVHGINAGPDCWIPFARAIASQTGAGKKRFELPFTTLDHCTPADCAGISFRDRKLFPEGFFAGCGPVEVGAALLARRIRETLTQVRSGAPLPLLESPASGRGMSYTYHAPGQVSGPALRLAIRRVDIVACSYGGVISRWYTASTGELYPGQAAWYRGTYVVPGSGGRPMDLCPCVRYHGDVRKLITIGSLWRGVPLNNYLSEVRFSQPDDREALAGAPLRFPRWVPKDIIKTMGGRHTLGSLVETINANMKVIAPASEVCAVDSWWLHTLTYGTSDTNLPKVASPFRDEIAYGSVAGDNSAYVDFGPLKGISLYGAPLFFQQPSRYPFHHLERRAGAGGSFGPLIGGARDYSDGLVPLWSALIPGTAPGTSQIVHASHSAYMVNREVQEYVERWLNNAALPTGRDLRPQWNTSITSRDNRKRWDFKDGEMAPQSLSGLYARIDGIARIRPDALHPDRTVTVKYEDNAIVRVEWALPAGGRLHSVTVYEDSAGTAPAPSPQPRRLRIIPAEMVDDRLCSIVDGLRKDRVYSIVAEAIIDNCPDLPVFIKSRAIRLDKAPVGAAGRLTQ